MRNRILVKLLAVGVLAFLLLVPLMMIQGTISERSRYRATVVADIARSYSNAQTLNGPLLVIPYRTGQWRIVDEKSGRKELEWTSHKLTVLPSKLQLEGNLAPDRRARGIYTAQVYAADLEMSGSFDIPRVEISPPAEKLEIGEADLALGISDIRGIRTSPTMDWGGKDYPFQPGSNVKLLGPGIHVPLGQLSAAGSRVAFKFKLGLNGMDDFSIVPLGRDTEVRLTSSWPHPSFVGQYLPEARQISAAGFNATWRTSWFSTNANERFQQCGEDHCEALSATVLGVRLIEPVDVYLMSERSVKYGFLFVFLTFGAFFLFEALKRVGIHPVQYGMVGLALALFFLLVISLSEHIAFPLAYSIAAGSCVALVGFYVSHVLHQARWGVGFGAMLGALYGLLYVLLQSEDYSLLLGSLLLFFLLAVAMIVTRQVDWYQLGGSSEPPRKPGEAGVA